MAAQTCSMGATAVKEIKSDDFGFSKDDLHRLFCFTNNISVDMA